MIQISITERPLIPALNESMSGKKCDLRNESLPELTQSYVFPKNFVVD